MTSIPVEAADFGPPALRYLPAADSGFTVSTGDQILLSEAQLFPPVATPARVQRVTLRATDPADCRGITIMASTYADAAAADLVVEAEPLQHGVSGHPMDLTGAQDNDIQGMWSEEEGFAPYSAGNPMRTIASTRARIG